MRRLVIKKVIDILLFAVFLIAGNVGYSGTIAPPYEVFGGLYGDFTGNNIVEIDDFSVFLYFWLKNDCNTTAWAYLNEDCRVNFYEFAVLAENWLQVPYVEQTGYINKR